MTAIYGALALDGRPAASIDLSGVDATLAPFGAPDRWRGEAGPLRAELGARRPEGVTALVVAAEGQLAACGDVHLTYAGDLRAALGPVAERADSDLALVVAAYERWGDACLERLYGDFAVAIVDLRRGGVLLARDHSGDRPLVYAQVGGALAFASNALALTAFDGIGHELDLERAAEVLFLAYGSERTFVRGVSWLMPASAVWIDPSGSRSWRWWRPEEIEPVDLGSLDAHAEELRAALDAAVAEALRGASHPGVLLSGGLDSASVAATAARLGGYPTLPSYTAVPPEGWDGPLPRGWIASERFAVEALVTMHPVIRPTFVDWTGPNLIAHHENGWELGSGPSRNVSNWLWVVACYQEAGADGVDLLLTGAVGNIAFSADGPRWLAELILRGRLLRTGREARAWLRGTERGLWNLVYHDVLGQLQPGWLRRLRQRHGRVGPAEDWMRATALRDDRLAGLDMASLMPGMVRPDPRGWTRDFRRLFHTGAAQSDTAIANELMWGFTLRDPTADRRLLEVSFAQPEWWRRHDGVDRAVCRRAMSDRLPPEIVDRRTRGSQLPDWFDRLSELRPEMRDELEATRDHPASREVIDLARLDLVLDNWPESFPRGDVDMQMGMNLALPRALLVSRYLRWFEERARRVAAGGPLVKVPL